MPTTSPFKPAEPETVGSPTPLAQRERLTAKDPATKLAHQGLSILQLAQELGSVSKACQQAGMDPTSFYEWKRRFQTHGLAGLKDLPPVHKSHPQTTPAALQERVIELALQRPPRGCNFLSGQLALAGTALSAQTIPTLLNKHGLGGRYERLLALEAWVLQQELELTPELVQALEKAN